MNLGILFPFLRITCLKSRCRGVQISSGSVICSVRVFTSQRKRWRPDWKYAIHIGTGKSSKSPLRFCFLLVSKWWWSVQLGILVKILSSAVIADRSVINSLTCWLAWWRYRRVKSILWRWSGEKVISAISQKAVLACKYLLPCSNPCTGKLYGLAAVFVAASYSSDWWFIINGLSSGVAEKSLSKGDGKPNRRLCRDSGRRHPLIMAVGPVIWDWF